MRNGAKRNPASAMGIYGLLVLTVALLSLFMLLQKPAEAALPPTTMNFQGRLADSSGNLMPDGLYNMQFRLFSVSSGGSAVWTETRETTNRVQVTNGLFSTQLGEANPLSASLFNATNLYFEITMATPGTATCSTASCATWESPMTPRQKLATSAYAFNSSLLNGKSDTDFAAASGSANYIQNTGTPQTADFNITGTGTANLLQASTFDRATSGTLTIGGTNATSINLADDVVVAGTNTLRITGDTSTNIQAIGSPTEGMITYDTTNKQLLTYTNGKWQADRSDAILVAASNSSQADKNAADYVADGDNVPGAGTIDGDQVQINNALTAGSGKKVVLLAGTYVADATILVPNNTTLAGVGNGTTIELAGINATDNLIENSDTTTGTGITIRDLKLDGRSDLNTIGIQKGIYANGIGDNSTQRKGINISSLEIKNFRTAAIELKNSDDASVTDSSFITNNEAIRLDDANYSIFDNNVFNGSTNSDFYNNGATRVLNNVISNSSFTFSGSGYAINLYSTNIIIEGNTIIANGEAIYLPSSIRGVVQGNNIELGIFNYGVWVSSSSNNMTVINNTINGGDIGLYIEGNNHNISSNNVTGANLGTYTDGTNNTYNNNSITDSVDQGMYAFDDNSIFSNNKVHNSGGNTLNNGIYLTSANNNSVTGNHITDTSCTTNCYAININSGTTNYLADNVFATGTINDAGTGTIFANQSMTAGGLDTLFKQANSDAAFQVQNATGTDIFTIDTNNSELQVGSATTDSTAIYFMLDQYDQATDPTNTVNGAMYYNTNLNKFRCYQNGGWTDCIGSGGGGAATDLSNLTSTSINQTLTPNANNSIDIGTSGTTWRSGYFGTALYTPAVRPLSDSATALQLQNAAGTTTILTVNTSSNNILIGDGSNGITLSSGGVVLAGNARGTVTETLTPEYGGATFVGDGTNNTGSLSSDFCSGSSRQNINPTFCGATETNNYYQWTTTEATAQDYDVYVRYQMPSNYSSGSMSNLQIWGWGTTSANEQVTVALIDDDSATPCATSGNAIASNTTWGQATVASPLGACTIAAGDTVTFRVHLVAGQNNNALAGAISFDYRSTF